MSILDLRIIKNTSFLSNPNIFFYPLFLVALGACLYFPHTHIVFILDDFPNLETLEQLKNSQYKLSDFINFLSTNQSGKLGRPLSLLSFTIQAESWPNDPSAFAIVNIIIHLVNSILVFILSCFLIEPLFKEKRYILSVIIAGLWLILPIHVSCILYVIQRMTLLMAFFSLLTLVGYLYGRHCYQDKLWKGITISSLSIIIGTLCATFSKENGILVLLYITIIEITIFSDYPDNKAWKIWRGLFIYVPLLVGGVYFLIHIPQFIGGYSARPFSLTERLLTESRILVDYIVKIIFPRPNYFGLFFDDYIVSTGILSPITTLFCLLLIATLLIVALLQRFKQPVLSFAIFWFFAGHILESTVIPLELYFEHRNYLPSLGLVFALCYYLYILILTASSKFSGYCFSGLFALYFVGIFIISYQEASLWNNPMLQSIIWQKNHPNSKRASIRAVSTWMSLKQAEKTHLLLQHIIALDKKDNTARILSLLIDCDHPYLTDTQRSHIITSIILNRNVNTGTVRSLRKLVDSWTAGKCVAISYNDISSILTSLSQTTTAQFKTHVILTMGVFYAKNNQYKKAIDIINKALMDIPNQPDLIILKIQCAIMSKQYKLALSWIENNKKSNLIHGLEGISLKNNLEKLENQIPPLIKR